MTIVLHYVQQWLPLSEQFVHAHVSRSRHRAVVVSRDPIDNETAFPHRPLLSLAGLIDRLPPAADRSARTAALGGIALSTRARAVHVHFGYRVHDVTGVAQRLRLPLVLSLHGHDITAYPSSYPRHYRGVFEITSAVIVPSAFLAGRAVAEGVPEDRLEIVPAGVDTAFFRGSPLADGPPVALFVGRFSEKKGIDVLLQAWATVATAVPAARLRLLGYGPLEDLLRDAPASVELVRPDPARRAEQVRDEMAAATLVVSPSRTATDGDAESLLLVNLEAQASGRAVVTTRHGGIPEFVEEGRTALLVPEADAPALAEALVEVLCDRDRAAELGAAGPALAARFDVTACAARVDEVYDRLAT